MPAKQKISDDDVRTIHEAVKMRVKTLRSITEEFGIAYSTLYQRFAKLGLGLPVRPEINPEKTRKRNESIVEEAETMPVRELAAKYNLSPPTIYAIIKRYSNSEGRKLRIVSKSA